MNSTLAFGERGRLFEGMRLKQGVLIIIFYFKGTFIRGAFRRMGAFTQWVTAKKRLQGYK